jgi:GMP synthase (glutamine-hydrolysing)
MKIHILQHVPFEGPGFIAEWAEENGPTLSYTKFFEAFTIPLPTDIDLLIVLGGPMSVDDTEQFHWLDDEKNYIGQMVKNGIKVLGICLGAQMIAAAMGAAVYPNEFKEVGWFPIRKNTAIKPDIFENLANEVPAFHWHGDTFDLPQGAKRLFSSEACLNQGFVFKEHVFALQFHWEVTKESVQQLIEFSGDDLSNGEYVQSVDELLPGVEVYAAIHQNMEKLLSFLSV